MVISAGEVLMDDDEPTEAPRTRVWLGDGPQREHLPPVLRKLAEADQDKVLAEWWRGLNRVGGALDADITFAFVSSMQLPDARAAVVRGARVRDDAYIAINEQLLDEETLATALEALVIDRIRYPTSDLPMFMWIKEHGRILVERGALVKEAQMPTPPEVFLTRARSVAAQLKNARTSADSVTIPKIGRVCPLLFE